MFDLPVITEKERKIATKFRKYLLDDGFIMMQYSVYSRICKNNDDLNKHINRLKIKLQRQEILDYFKLLKINIII